MHETPKHAGAVSLRDLFPEARIVGAEDIRVTSCCSEPRRCRRGDLYVALLGPGGDGHDEVPTAIQHGATSVLAERLLPVNVPVCIVQDTRQAYSRLCLRLLGQPSDQVHLIGVTGTSGKTTTAVLVRSVLEAAGRRAGVTCTLGHFDGLEVSAARRTTPAPPEMAQCLARMAANGCSHAVVELSSRALAERRVAGLTFDGAVLTNVRRDHLDYHGSIANYRRAKARLLEQLRPDGFAVLNADDPASRSLLSRLDQPVLTIGLHSPAELTATVVERYKSEQTFLLTAGATSFPVRTRMIGNHHIYNCLAAAAVGLVLGIDPATVVRGLEAVEHVPGRLERLECGQPFGVFVDYARTPETLGISLATLRQVTERRLICVFGADARRDPQMRPLLGRVVERGADLGLITNDNPRDQSPWSIVHDILDGYERPARAHIIPDRAKAIRWALAQARCGDTVLIAGKGNENKQIIGQTPYPFDDRQIARQWLYQIGAKTDYAASEQQVFQLKRHIA